MLDVVQFSIQFHSSGRSKSNSTLNREGLIA